MIEHKMIVGCAMWMGQAYPDKYINNLSSFIQFNQIQSPIQIYLFYSSKYYDLPSHFDELYARYSNQPLNNVEFKFIDTATHPELAHNPYINWLESFEPIPFAYISDYLRFRMLELLTKNPEHQHDVIVFMEMDVEFIAPIPTEKIAPGTAVFSGELGQPYSLHFIIVNQANKRCCRLLENVCIAYENLYTNLLSQLPLLNPPLVNEILKNENVYLAGAGVKFKFDCDLFRDKISFNKIQINWEFSFHISQFSQDKNSSKKLIKKIDSFLQTYPKIDLEMFWEGIHTMACDVISFHIMNTDGVKYFEYQFFESVKHLAEHKFAKHVSLNEKKKAELSHMEIHDHTFKNEIRYNSELDDFVRSKLIKFAIGNVPVEDLDNLGESEDFNIHEKEVSFDERRHEEEVVSYLNKVKAIAQQTVSTKKQHFFTLFSLPPQIEASPVRKISGPHLP